MGLFKLYVKLVALLMLLAFAMGGCASGLGRLAKSAVSEAEKIDLSEIESRVESAVDGVAEQVSGAVGRYHTTLKGEATSFTVEDEEGAETCSLRIKDLYFTKTNDIKLEIKPAKEVSVTIECPRDMLDYGVSADIKDGVITVSCDPERAFTCDSFKITVTGVCDSVYIGSGMDVDIDAAGAPDFTFEVDGAVNGKVRNLDAGAVTMTINGAASLELSGQTDSLECVMNGAGTVDAGQLAAAKADVTINGAGGMELTVADELRAALYGAGSITYHGDPEVKKEIGGIGKIEKAAD